MLADTIDLPNQEGAVDGVVDGTIRGWALTVPSVGLPVAGARILVICDGLEIAVIQALKLRDDVANAKGCDPNCGFSFRPPAPYQDGRHHVFRFVTLPNRVELTHSPVSFQVPDRQADGETARLRSALSNLRLQLRALQPGTRPTEPATDVSLDLYAEWAARYLPALRARISRARSSNPRWLSGNRGRSECADPGCKVSVVLPLYRPHGDQLEASVHSILNQTYEDWELILVDDGSASRDLCARIQAFCHGDQRIRAISRLVRGGIAAAANDAMDIATGTLVTVLDQADELVDVALEVMVNEIVTGRHVAAYSDEDTVCTEGRLARPWLKTDFNPRLLLAQNCVGRLLVVRRDALDVILPLETIHDDVQDHAVALAIAGAFGKTAIHHVPEVLYHRRTSTNRSQTPVAASAGEVCIAAHLDRRGLRADVHAVPGTARYAVEWRSGTVPAVSVIVTGGRRGRDLVSFATALQGATRYRRMEILLAGHQLGLGDCGHALHRSPGNTRMLERATASPRAVLLNEAAAAATGHYLLFLHDTGLPRSIAWLRLLLDEIQAEDDVAVVGCKHLASDGTVRGGAIALGIDGPGAPMHVGLNAADPGYRDRAACVQDVSAVSLDGLLCRADAFRVVGGFDDDMSGDTVLAADLCGRLATKGYRTIWTPAVIFDHAGPDQAWSDADTQHMEHGPPDPSYNVNFARRGGTFRALDGGRLDPLGDLTYNLRCAVESSVSLVPRCE